MGFGINSQDVANLKFSKIQFEQNQNFDLYNASCYTKPCYSTKFYLKNGVCEGTVVVL